MSCSCCTASPKQEKTQDSRKQLVYLFIITAAVAAGILGEHELIPFLDKELVLFYYIFFYLLAGLQVLKNAVGGIRCGDIFNENFLMSIATIGAFFIGQYPEALGVMVFYRWGTYFENMAERKSKQSIKSLMALRPDSITLKTGDSWKTSELSAAKPGMIFRLQAGERAGVDGKIIKGEATADTSALTGESVPRVFHVGSELLAGVIVEKGVIELEVLREAHESSLERILKITENAVQSKSLPERFVTRFSRVYTPIVVALCLFMALMPPLLLNADWKTWITRALTLLVISCPCALVISVPLGYFGGIGRASRIGIIFKGSQFLDLMRKVTTIIFDKTGTLTNGEFAIESMTATDKKQEHELKELAAAAELFSNHPIALSVKKYTKDIQINENDISDYEEIRGKGISLLYKGKHLYAGTRNFLQSHHLEVNDTAGEGTLLYIAYNNHYKGYFVINDSVKPTSKSAVQHLKKRGITSVMLTGDHRTVAQKIAGELTIDEYHAELLPEDKLSMLNEIKKNTLGKIAFVGDGINDSPSIAAADIGFAMGKGSDSALEVADAVALTNDIEAINKAFLVAGETHAVVMQNIIASLGIKFLIMILGIMGLASMWLAVFADTGVMILAILNSSRLLIKPKELL
jgi:Cd2+/Zn2+-exporting ATPase